VILQGDMHCPLLMHCITVHLVKLCNYRQGIPAFLFRKISRNCMYSYVATVRLGINDGKVGDLIEGTAV